MNSSETIAKNILYKINKAEKILIIASKPIDCDSLGTALTIDWWLKKIGKKEIFIYTFAYIPDNFRTFHSLERVVQNQMSKVDFKFFDLIILADGNSWRQFLTNDYNKYLSEIDKNKVVNIDHHEQGELNEILADSSLRVLDSCTSKVFYDFFIEPSGVVLDKEVSTWMYLALIGDTGTFSFGIYPKTFSFADLLINNKVDHIKAVDFDITKNSMDFLVWAIKHTDYYPEIQSTIFLIDDEKNKEIINKFGKNWDKDDIDRYYKSVFMRMVRDFPYGIILEARDDNTKTEVSWRTKNYGTKIEIMKVLQKAGFKAGGHRHAGGGMGDFPIVEAKNRFITEIKRVIKELSD